MAFSYIFKLCKSHNLWIFSIPLNYGQINWFFYELILSYSILSNTANSNHDTNILFPLFISLKPQVYEVHYLSSELL